MITIIDYGVGNLFSLSSSLSYLGLENKVSRDPEDLRKADHIILPGENRSRQTENKTWKNKQIYAF